MVNKKSNRLLLFTIALFIVTVVGLTSAVFAWVSSSNQNTVGEFVGQVKDLSVSTDFYMFKEDGTFTGSDLYELTDNVCTSNNDCYELIANPTANQVLPDKLRPGNKLSYAIKITNTSSTPTTIDLKLLGVSSLLFQQSNNQIQRAFKYEVKAVRYLNGVTESSDQKSNFTFANAHFLLSVADYDLISNVDLANTGEINSVVIVFFDLYFDPQIGSYDGLGNLENNANAFMNQQLIVDKLMVDYGE